MFGLGDHEWRWKAGNRGVSGGGVFWVCCSLFREARAGW